MPKLGTVPVADDRYEDTIRNVATVLRDQLRLRSDEKIKIPENILIKIITFGFNSKSTIMISSVKENYIIISVQREIEKLNGDIIENQEKKIEIEQNKKSSIYNEIINFLIKEL